MDIYKSLQLIMMTAMCVAGLPKPESPQPCGRTPADVIFMVDTSNSIWSYDFNRYVLPFLSGVVETFDVGPSARQTRVGVVTFSGTYHLQFHLGDILDKELLRDKISNIPLTRGDTNTGEALNYVTREMFKKENGARGDVKRLIIILTDGTSQDPMATEAAAIRAHELGFVILSIGVGKNVDVKELSDLASDPDEEFMFRVTNFEALEQLKSRLSYKACQEHARSTTRVPSTSRTTTSTTPEPKPEPVKTTAVTKPHAVTECGSRPADIYFILDSSSSIEPFDYSVTMLNFVRSVAGLFNLGPGREQTRVGIATFSDDVTQIFPLNGHSSRDELLAAISPDNIPHKAQGTNTAAAIQFVQQVGFSPEVARADAAHIAIVITDGQSKDPSATSKAAEAAHNAGIHVFAIGVGESVDLKELSDIASDPDKKFAFYVDDFAALAGIQNHLANRTCAVKFPDIHLSDAKECSLNDAELLFVFDSFSMGLQATRHITSEAGIITSSINRRVRNLSAGMISEACAKGLDIELREADSFAGQAKYTSRALVPRTINLMKEARRKWFSLGRKSGRHVMVLYLNEGNGAGDYDDIVSQARYAKAKGIEVYVVALGKVSEQLTSVVASQPLDNHVIKINSSDNLPSIRGQIVANLCKDTNKEEEELVFNFPVY